MNKPLARPLTGPLTPGACIGILGGGQLGRMLSVAAARLGFSTHIFEPGQAPPAGHVAAQVTTAEYNDIDALTAFAASVDVITFEFENIPTTALDVLEAHCPIRPSREALRVSQDRLIEKEFLSGLGLNIAPFANVESLADLKAALAKIGTPAILKTRRFGYDGKGQVRIFDIAEASTAWNAMKGAPSVLEGLVEFSREISVIAARGVSGEIACFDPGENVHVDGILATTTIPASLSKAHQTDAVLLAANILNALGYIGVLGVEIFVTSTGLVVNEIAPRVHNSGHWTQNGCAIDQFEQHIRAIAGWPLGDGIRHANVMMENLIGDDMARINEVSREPNTALHLYGKTDARPGRKMGHLNRVTPLS